ncbi:MAG: hypothetical protein LBQ60_15145 [Bacteroidales bacterium]|jgi:hypothetical protein|nr:hypothetical protein [Bacteroidales bacterium]
MKKYKFYIMGLWLFCIASVSLFSSCSSKDDDDNGIGIDDSYKPVKITPISGIRIAWDYSSLKQLAAKGAAPQMIRTANELVAVYASEDNVYLISSQDEGITWSTAVTLFPKGSHTGKNGNEDLTYKDLMGQPTITLLQNGDLVASCAVRYQYELTGTTTEYPAAIKIRRINSDLTLEPITEVYANLGVENPSFLQLPDGKLQLYFADGGTPVSITALNSTELLAEILEQQLVVIESNDNGQTWSSEIKDFGPDGVNRRWTGARTVASRAYKQNTWPSPAVLGDEIVVALSDNKTMTFKPYTVRCPLVENWRDAVRGDTPDRDYALYEILPDKYFMGITRMIVLPTGETLLSYQTDEGRNPDFELMEVAIGTSKAENFKYRTRPFPFESEEKAVRNSLMLFDNKTILALTTSNHGLLKNQEAPFYMKGHLVNDLTIIGDQVTDHPMFVGGKTEANITAGLGIDGNNLYVGIIAKDNTTVTAEPGTQAGDGVYLYIDADNLSLLDVDTGISKFWISSAGHVNRWNGKEGQWVEASAEGITVTPNSSSDGYTLDVVIPRSSLTNFNSQGKGIRFGIGLSDYTTSSTGVTELLSLCKDLRSSSWLGVTFE